LILDTRLCRTQGQSLVDALRQDSRFSQLPLLLTATIRDQVKLLSSGALDVLPRPLQPQSHAKALLRNQPPKTVQTSTGSPGHTNQATPSVPQWNGQVRILIAEDHPVNLDIASRLLAKMGCLSDPAITGQQALEALARQSYDLVLMDIQMPEMDGLEAAQAIRDPTVSVLNHAVPIVAMSAFSFSEEKKHRLAWDLNDFLLKPVSFVELAAVLRKWLPFPPQATSPLPDSPSLTLPGWDSNLILRRWRGDALLARSILRNFLDDFAMRIENLRKTAGANDFPALTRQILTFRASVIASALTPLLPPLSALEQAVGRADAAAIQTELAAFTSTFEGLRTALADFSQQGKT
jgi:CheY-like chemotaxis protein